MSFATWQSTTGDTNSQAGIAGSGNFTPALFVNAATGDLHLVPGGNALVNGKGTPIVGVTDDYDGNPRSATTPSIGSHEIPLTPVDTWRLTYFGSTANTGNGASPVDFDHDGLVNLLEFAFGLNPTQSDSAQLPQPVRTGGNLVLTFTQPGSGGITYGAEWSTSLLPGSWTPIPDTGSGDTHTFSVPEGGNEKLFFRMKVSEP